MIPHSHSHAMYSQTQAESLATTILSASSPPLISAAISAVDSFLRSHPSDQSRPFFSLAFPPLLCKLFGFNDSASSSSSTPSSSSNSRPLPATGWIDQTDPEISSRLFDLLSPDGILLSTIASVDRHSLVRYVFPVELLPEWMRHVLLHSNTLTATSSAVAVLSDLCPLFKSSIRKDTAQNSLQFHLNIFEYYMFWFAYYPVCRGNSENSDPVVIRKARRFHLENWTSSFPVLSGGKRRTGQKTECSLYLRLLYAYLRAFVPKCGSGGPVSSYQQPYRSSLLHYSPSYYDGSVMLQAEFLVNTFVQFWMVYNDFSPLPVSLCCSFGLSFPFRTVLGEVPPTVGLAEVLKILVKYLNSSIVPPSDGGDQVEISGSPVWIIQGSWGKSKAAPISSENFVGLWNSVMQRPLYRFILRSFLFCPMGTSVNNVAQVFTLWTNYLEPWKTSEEEFVERLQLEARSNDNLSKQDSKSQEETPERKGKCNFDSSYTHAWKVYVLSNYLFYNSLVVHFLGFAHKFLHANAEVVIQMAVKVLSILTSSKELTDLLKKVDAAYHSKSAGSSSSTSDSLYKFIPPIREQLQDWEDGLCESNADGSFLHENRNHELRLFIDGEDGAHQLLQLLILRAEPEIQAISGENEAQNLQNLASLKAQMNILFGGPVRKSSPPTPARGASCQLHGQDEIFTPKHPGVGKRTWADVKYKGDWMRRPISDSEVAWLARHLIRLSDFLNDFLGLSRVGGSDDSLGRTYIEVPPTEFSSVHSAKEAFWMLLFLVGSWILMLAQVVLRFTRGRGWRINLRVLASKKFIVAVFLFAATNAVRKAFGLCLLSPFTNTNTVYV